MGGVHAVAATGRGGNSKRKVIPSRLDSFMFKKIIGTPAIRKPASEWRARMARLLHTTAGEID